MELASLGWPIVRAPDAIAVLAKSRRFPVSTAPLPTPPTEPQIDDEAAFRTWIDASAAWLGLEAEPVNLPYDHLEASLRGIAPALVRIPGEKIALAITKVKRDHAIVVGADLRVHRMALARLRALVCGAEESRLGAEIGAWLDPLLGSGARADRARQALVRERMSGRYVPGIWLIRLPPGSALGEELAAERIPLRLLSLVALQVVQTLLVVAGWYLLGRGALEGHFDAGWLVAWGMLLFTAIPFRLFAVWIQGHIAIDIGRLFRRRSLAGALRLDPEMIRSEGAGELFGRVIETSAVEALALSGGFQAVLSVLEMAAVLALLGASAGGAVLALSFAAWSIAAVGFAWRAYRRIDRWAVARRELTNELVEQMMAHRTRLAQLHVSRWHDAEDASLERYLRTSLATDRTSVVLQALPSAWLAFGLLELAPILLHESGKGLATFAVALGGVLLGQQVLSRLGLGAMQIASAGVAWRQVAPLFAAAAKMDAPMSPEFALDRRTSEADGPGGGVMLEAEHLVFSYPQRPEPVLRHATLRIAAGERVLLEGPSGGGKSTLATVVAGLQPPESGLLLFGGIDRHTLGVAGWRQRVALAAQFHDNHVLTETFAFNVLMGRGWPPEPRDLREAFEVCKALGLGELLERMPAGIMQMVGESGWRLSHGERSRLFLARALLQRANLVILDESFAALDPRTLEQCLTCVIERAPSLLVIAHP
jgi:ATP-binding cassette subfamily B protein